MNEVKESVFFSSILMSWTMSDTSQDAVKWAHLSIENSRSNTHDSNVGPIIGPLCTLCALLGVTKDSRVNFDPIIPQKVAKSWTKNNGCEMRTVAMKVVCRRTNEKNRVWRSFIHVSDGVVMITWWSIHDDAEKMMMVWCRNEQSIIEIKIEWWKIH